MTPPDAVSGRSKQRRGVLATNANGNGSHSQKTCVVEGCDRPLNHKGGSTQGWCPAHAARYYRLGDVQAYKPIGERNLRGVWCIPVEPLKGFIAKYAAEHPQITDFWYRGLPTGRLLDEKHQQMFYRATRRGGLSIWAADSLACALGVHPVQVWSDWFELTEEAS